MSGNRIKLSVQVKIILSLLIVVFFLASVTVVVVKNRVEDSMLNTKKETIDLAVQQQAEQIDIVLNESKRVAEQVPGIPGISDYLNNDNRQNQDTKTLRILTDFIEGRQVESISLLDTQGVVVLSTDDLFLEKELGHRSYFLSALSGVPATEMLIDIVSKEPGIVFSAPVKDKMGKVIGVSIVKADIQPVYETLIDSYIDRLGKFMLVNDDGVVVFANKENALYKSLGVMGEEIKKMIQNEDRYSGKEIESLDYDEAQRSVESGAESAPIYEFFDEDDGVSEYIKMVRVGDSPLYLISEVESGTVTDVVNSLVTSVIVTILSILFVGVVVQIFLLRRVLKPLFTLNKYALSVSGGNFNETLTVKTSDELETLAESIKKMVSTIKDFYSGLEEKVKEKTAELEKTLEQIEAKNIDLENTKKAVLNVMEDLNEEKDRIFYEKNRIETILKSIGDGVFVTDGEGKITIINKAAEEITGHRLVDSVGKYYSTIFKFGIEGHPEIKYRDFVKEVLETGSQITLDKHSVILDKKGNEIPILDSAAPVKDVDGKTYGCVTVFRDNTRERELERSKDDFLSVTSHQLRTPLGSMRWNVEMLLAGDSGKLPDEALELATQIHEGNLRMINLVNDLLNVNRIDQGRVMDEPVKTDLAVIIKEAVKELNYEADRRKIKINMDLEKIDGIVIDPKRFREVITNLISNAVKYNRVGGWVKITLNQEKKWIQMIIEDNGVGIPKKDAASIFRKFFRASNAVQSETEGSGLGLYVVKKFVEGWGGKIELSSKEGKGSKFTIYLPLKINKTNTDE
ncbi:MAG TPA: ATP-binding protein [Candidatus Woesebacteria bacterium]|nr:ATP-binding protein [Candidatus Woesebacteria bacterium]